MNIRSLPQGRQVAPSILSADFSKLGKEVGCVIDAGARVIHVDVMDGHFVPPITIGPLVVESIADQVHDAGGFLDVHLMIEQPQLQIKAFAAAGADSITIHCEASSDLGSTLAEIRERGCLCGASLNPTTPVEKLEDISDQIDIALCMSVNPGWGGQSFIETSVEKIGRMRNMLPSGVSVEVDGGIDTETAPGCAQAGADLLVAGSAVFKKQDPAAAYQAIVEAIDA